MFLLSQVLLCGRRKPVSGVIFERGPSSWSNPCPTSLFSNQHCFGLGANVHKCLWTRVDWGAAIPIANCTRTVSCKLGHNCPEFWLNTWALTSDRNTCSASIPLVQSWSSAGCFQMPSTGNPDSIKCHLCHVLHWSEACFLRVHFHSDHNCIISHGNIDELPHYPMSPTVCQICKRTSGAKGSRMCCTCIWKLHLWTNCSDVHFWDISFWQTRSKFHRSGSIWHDNRTDPAWTHLFFFCQQSKIEQFVVCASLASQLRRFVLLETAELDSTLLCCC